MDRITSEIEKMRSVVKDIQKTIQKAIEGIEHGRQRIGQVRNELSSAVQRLKEGSLERFRDDLLRAQDTVAGLLEQQMLHPSLAERIRKNLSRSLQELQEAEQGLQQAGDPIIRACKDLERHEQEWQQVLNRLKEIENRLDAIQRDLTFLHEEGAQSFAENSLMLLRNSLELAGNAFLGRFPKSIASMPAPFYRLWAQWLRVLGECVRQTHSHIEWMSQMGFLSISSNSNQPALTLEGFRQALQAFHKACEEAARSQSGPPSPSL